MSKTLVFFGAHPDDESFGPGSTLARYASAGVKVYYVCSTGGEEGTVAPEHLKGHASIAELRSAELKCAGEAVGLAGVFHLSYRDSGMRGSELHASPLYTDSKGWKGQWNAWKGHRKASSLRAMIYLS